MFQPSWIGGLSDFADPSTVNFIGFRDISGCPCDVGMSSDVQVGSWKTMRQPMRCLRWWIAQHASPWQSIELGEVMEKSTNYPWEICHCHVWWNNDHLIMIKYGNHEIIIVPLDYCKWNQMKQLIIWWQSHIWMKRPYYLFILILLITQCYTFLESKRILSWWSMAAMALSIAQNSCPLSYPHPICTSHCIHQHHLAILLGYKPLKSPIKSH
jgi:hypothetical protein